MIELKVMDTIFDEMELCKGVQQMYKHHPEGDVYIHLLQTTEIALREVEDDIDLIFAAMLHDVGKRIKSKGHAKISCDIVCDFVSVKTIFLIENHMRIWSYIKGEMRKKSKLNTLINHPWLKELIQLARFDMMARRENYIPKFDRGDIIDKIQKCCRNHFRPICCISNNIEQNISIASKEGDE